jgi:hypothetical protein
MPEVHCRDPEVWTPDPHFGLEIANRKSSAGMMAIIPLA